MMLLFCSEEATSQGRILRQCSVLLLTICLLVVFLAACAWGAIPTTERTVLQNLYSSTNGVGWTQSPNWNGPAGTECTWHGVYCDGSGNHVVSIYLPSNNLVGTLPSLSDLTYLQSFWFQNNQLTGSIPSLSGLTDLQAIILNSNQLTGSIPSLSELTNLVDIYIADNQLTGSIPSLSGLSKLAIFDVSINKLTGSIPSISSLTDVHGFYTNNNNLTGSIPSLTGLTNLVDFRVDYNQLTGSIPPLSGLTNLRGFYANSNNLTGSIPSLNGLTSLQYVYVFSNQLTGSIPQLSGLTSLSLFYANDNQFTGLIPSLSGLASLRGFTLNNNQLTGSIPSLTGLSSLEWFSVSGNQLTGAIPSLSGLASLHNFTVVNNYLSGNVPAVPTPNNLTNGQSHLCPNNLNATASSAWDTATATTPWYQQCTSGPAKFSVNYDGIGSTGGNVPDTGSIYTTGVTVTVLGNTGALYKTGYSFDGWNTAADGGGTSYAGSDTFNMGSNNVMLFAKWKVMPVRNHDTGEGYSDIQGAYNKSEDGDIIEALVGQRGQHLLISRPISIKLVGGYNDTFTMISGTTTVSESIEVRGGSIELANIVIQ